MKHVILACFVCTLIVTPVAAATVQTGVTFLNENGFRYSHTIRLDTGKGGGGPKTTPAPTEPGTVDEIFDIVLFPILSDAAKNSVTDVFSPFGWTGKLLPTDQSAWSYSVDQDGSFGPMPADFETPLYVITYAFDTQAYARAEAASRDAQHLVENARAALKQQQKARSDLERQINDSERATLVLERELLTLEKNGAPPTQIEAKKAELEAEAALRAQLQAQLDAAADAIVAAEASLADAQAAEAEAQGAFDARSKARLAAENTVSGFDYVSLFGAQDGPVQLGGNTAFAGAQVLVAGTPPAIPLPASALLLIAGLGALTVLRAKRSAR